MYNPGESVGPAVVSAQLSEQLTDYLGRLSSMSSREQRVPEFLPPKIRRLAATKCKGEFGARVQMTQERINDFVRASGDAQFLHTDEEQAKQGPFKGIIAHGDLTHSLDVVAIPEMTELLEAGIIVIRVDKYVRLRRPVRLDVFVVARMNIISAHSPDRGEGVELFYEFQFYQDDLCKLVAEGHGTILCLPKF